MAKDNKEKPAVTLGGAPDTLFGTFPGAGQQAPDFTLVDKDLKDVSLQSFADKQAVFLRTHGCQMAQGYLYSKPMPKSAFELLPQSHVLARGGYCRD